MGRKRERDATSIHHMTLVCSSHSPSSPKCTSVHLLHVELYQRKIEIKKEARIPLKSSFSEVRSQTPTCHRQVQLSALNKSCPIWLVLFFHIPDSSWYHFLRCGTSKGGKPERLLHVSHAPPFGHSWKCAGYQQPQQMQDFTHKTSLHLFSLLSFYADLRIKTDNPSSFDNQSVINHGCIWKRNKNDRVCTMCWFLPHFWAGHGPPLAEPCWTGKVNCSRAWLVCVHYWRVKDGLNAEVKPTTTNWCVCKYFGFFLILG